MRSPGEPPSERSAPEAPGGDVRRAAPASANHPVVGAAGLTDSAIQPAGPSPFAASRREPGSESDSSSSSSVGGTPALQSDDERRIGTTVSQGKYRILRMLGRGGMSTVYEGVDTVLGRSVAIKFLPTRRLSKPVSIERFIREAQVAGSLQHPNIITIYEHARDESGLYIVMELLHPESAGSRLKRGPYHWRVATRILVDCCAALDIAHKAGIIHRDIKPDNILFSKSGMVKLIDFGLVKLMEGNLHLTQSDAVCGTPIYMSPEQALKQKLDPRSDIYSLGSTYYSLLTAWPPFLGMSVVQIALQHVRAPAPNPRLLVPDIPEACVRVMMRAMNKQREERFQTAADMGKALEALLDSRQRTVSILDLDLHKQPIPELPMAAMPAGMTPSDPATMNPLATQSQTMRAMVLDLPQGWLGAASSPRRKFLIGGLTGLLGLGVAGVGALLSGQRLRASRQIDATPPPTSGPVEVMASAGSIPVGVLHSLSGALAVSERPLAEAVLLAIDEVNAQGGLLGKQLRPILLDGKSEVTADSAFSRNAERLLTQEKAAAVFGGYGSAVRKILLPIFEEHDGLLFYPSNYEGLEESRSLIYLGATPNQFALPAIEWCIKQLHARRFFLIGVDGVRAHAISAILEDSIRALGGELVGTHYDLIGELQLAPTIKKIAKARPDLVLNMLVGDSLASFFAALVQAGGPQVPILSFFLCEEALADAENPKLGAQYVARARFPASTNTERTPFAQRFAKRSFAASLIDNELETAYYGVHLWAAAVKRAGSTDVGPVRAALTGGEFDLAGVHLRVDPSNQHTWKVFELGKLVGPEQLQLIETGAAPIPPLPFPGPRTQTEWQDFTESLYRKWGGNWANPLKPHASRKPK